MPSRPANWTATLGSITGQHHWPSLLTPLASCTGQQHWSAPLAGNIGQDPSQYDDDDGDADDVNVADDGVDSYDEDDANDDDGAGDDELTIHSIMSVDECARHAHRLAKLASKRCCRPVVLIVLANGACQWCCPGPDPC